MEMENKKDTFQIFLPDAKGNVKARPIVNSERVISSPKKAEISLWDSFCNLIGYKTEKYKAYEAQKKQEAAKAELGKPFPQEAELAAKSQRLAELDAALNMEDTVESRAEKGEAERPSVLADLKSKAEHIPPAKRSEGYEEVL